MKAFQKYLFIAFFVSLFLSGFSHFFDNLSLGDDFFLGVFLATYIHLIAFEAYKKLEEKLEQRNN